MDSVQEHFMWDVNLIQQPLLNLLLQFVHMPTIPLAPVRQAFFIFFLSTYFNCLLIFVFLF